MTLDLNNLRALYEAATKGEWRRNEYDEVWCGPNVLAMVDDPQNAAFIVAAHNAIPALLDACERGTAAEERINAQAELDAARAVLQSAHADHCETGWNASADCDCGYPPAPKEAFDAWHTAFERNERAKRGAPIVDWKRRAEKAEADLAATQAELTAYKQVEIVFNQPDGPAFLKEMLVVKNREMAADLAATKAKLEITETERKEAVEQLRQLEANLPLYVEVAIAREKPTNETLLSMLAIATKALRYHADNPSREDFGHPTAAEEALAAIAAVTVDTK